MFTIELDLHYRHARNEMMSAKLIGMTEPNDFGKLDTHRRKLVGFTVEAAWAQAHQSPYVARPEYSQVDDVLGYQLRGTLCAGGGLFVHAADPDGIFILGVVDDECTKVRFMGWTTKQWATNRKRWTTAINGYKLPRPAFYTAQTSLHDMSMLPESPELHAHRILTETFNHRS